MDINFRGIVDLHALPTTEPLLPLYEAVVNSIQSISQANITDGFINIKIERETNQLTFGNWETDIENIIIRDNGVGFTNDNYLSFNTYASDFKKMLGCKGVGRMIWLKAFTSVEIESIYEENGKYYLRTFNFDEQNAVNNMQLSETNESHNLTKVALKGLKSKCKASMPKKITTIARDILNHCFLYFVIGSVPRITIEDEENCICINSLFDDIESDKIETETFTIDNYNFSLVHFKNYNSGTSNHYLNLCANERKVSSINLHNMLKGINGRFDNNEGGFAYCGYITSSFLDENVNRERTEFNIEESQQTLFSSITKAKIIETATEYILSYLAEDIGLYNEKKNEKIESFVFGKHPKYRYLLKKYPQCINNIVYSDDEDKLELELFKQEQEYKLKLKEEGRILENAIKQNTNQHDLVKKTTEYAEKLSDIGKSNLAEYIVHRKSVLELLQSYLSYQNDNDKSYAYEESIHQIVFPMHSTSDDVDYMSHNLWLIDEKLAYHYYLASDMKFNGMSVVESKSDEKPDIAIFDSPFAFTDEGQQPFRNITIIEFKRPGRSYYTDDDNPIQQVIGYMENILNGKVKTKNGLVIESNERIRFFCYILCDMNNKIKDQAKRADFQETPDGMGRYRYMNNYNAYVEIMPYNKMIQDSNKRNKILFDKLFNQ